MREARNLTEALQQAAFGSYQEIFETFRTLSQKYGNLSQDGMIAAFTRVSGQGAFLNNPYIQNRRVKGISSLPADFTKDQVGEMLRSAESNEQPLRQVEHGLEYTAYPLFHMRKVYQDLLTYHNCFTPAFVDREDVKKDAFWREWRLLEKLRRELNPGRWAHQIAGQAMQEGKVFYVPRVEVDKSHNEVCHAFLQQLPSDWTKIVGFNNKSKYTVSFNLFYFLQPGTNPLQFGDLFLPYLDPFFSLLPPKPPKGTGRTVLYASKNALDLTRFEAMQKAGTLGGEVDAYYQNGRWFYWVTLPVDKVFPFEIDDANRAVVSPWTGLFLSLIQLAQYEQVQLELVQNPLISLLTGEIPYYDSQSSKLEDTYRLSRTGQKMFESFWYQMLEQSNTSGIGLYMAPLENMRLHTLSEAPGATEISSNGYAYTMAKAGLAGIIPTKEDPKAGLAQISFKIESRFARQIYGDFERMVNCIVEGLHLNYRWTFRMFGDLATDGELEESARKGMTLGILPDTILYNALHDRSILDDMAVSWAVKESGIMDTRLPLVTSYSAKNPDSNLPPEVKHELNPGGRPGSGGKATSEGQEQDIDQGGGAV